MSYNNPNWAGSWSQLTHAMNHLDETQWNKLTNYLESGNYTRAEIESIVGDIPEMKTMYNQNGELIGVTYNGAGAINTTINNTASQINSNVAKSATNSSALVKQAVQIKEKAGQTGYTVTKELTKWRGGSPTPSTGGVLLSSVLSGVLAVSCGGSLGKTIDRTLYNANPDFWDSHGMGAINPDTWASITEGENGLGASILNAFLDIDPNTGNPTMYVDETALAYVAKYYQLKGLFEPTDATVSDATLAQLGLTGKVTLPIHEDEIIIKDEEDNEYFTCTGKMASFSSDGGSRTFIVCASNTAFDVEHVIGQGQIIDHVTTPTTVLGETIYLTSIITSLPNVSNVATADESEIARGVAYIMVYGNHSYNIDGINDQPNAQLPQLNSGMSVSDVLDALKAQYPDLWDNRIEYTPNGNDTHTYVPVTMPTGGVDNQPTNDGVSQNDPTVNISQNGNNVSDTLLKLIFDMINQQDKKDDGKGMPDDTPDSSPDTPTPQPQPPTPDDPTGDGSTPTVTPPTGSASALWKIYNPSQSQLDSFGAWLWSSDFVDQIKKLFNDPMQAIIGLHKIYATPSVGGATTIKVGYLDSEVPSNYVSGQYVTVNCGSVNMKEYFGNVFDYSPFTKINLYLPFIGIVDIDNSDVMRGSVNIVYHIDVLTGACLVEVKCSRDLNNVTMYTFSGNCAVQYPVSSGSYVGIVTGLLGMTAGVIGSVASGGALAPMLMGMGASIGSIHTDIKHSGDISANAGAMGVKKPYFIISRPQTHMPENNEIIEGLPQNKTVTLNTLKNFVIVKKCHYDGIACTATELDKIKSLLESGVYIN